MKRNRIAMGILAGAMVLIGLCFSATPAHAAHIGIGIGLGVAPGYYGAPPPAVYAPPPPYPGPGYYWTNGYYNPYGVWVRGFGRPGMAITAVDSSADADTTADALSLVSAVITGEAASSDAKDAAKFKYSFRTCRL